MGCRVVDGWMRRGFYRLGLWVAQAPGYFILTPIMLTLLCVTGYQRIQYQMDPEYLFSPENGDGKYERAVVESYFKMNYSNRFNPTRVTRPGRFGRVIVLPKEGNNLLSEEVWAELRELDWIIRNTSIEYGEDKTLYRFEDMCARWEGRCFENDILNLDAIMKEVVEGKLNLTFPIMINPVTWDMHTFPVYFGGTVLSEDNVILSVPSLQLGYFVTADSPLQDHRGSMWEEAFLEAVGEAEDSGRFQYISTARFASRTLDIELEKNTQSVVPYFGSTFIIMVVFSTITCTMSDWVRSKPLLGLMGNVSAIMGTLAGFGLAIYMGIDFIGINLVSPLLMCSIGIDDTFVMLAAWRRTQVTDPVPLRLAQTMSEAAVSISITSLTDMVSLWVGLLSPFPSIRIFCLYSSIAVAFIFVWHVTFFAACMALAGYAEQDNRHSLTCCKVLPVSMSGERSWLYRLLCSGGVNPKDPDNPADNPENLLMAFFRDSVGPKLSWWPTKVLVLLLFGVYLGGALYGLTNLQEGLQRRKLSRTDSYSIEFYDREDFYFRDFPYRMQVVISDKLNYSDDRTHDRIELLTKQLEASPYISTALYTESWLRSFLGYVKRNQEYLNVSIATEQDFIATLKELWLFRTNPFSLDVKFNENETEILASRFLIQAVDIVDGNMEKDMVRDLRRICRQSDLNVTVFHPYFVYFDQFELVRPTSIQCMVVGAVVMMIISFIFIPNVLCSLWVAFCIVSIETGVAGYMALWDVNLDSISMINLIMCIGFSVDFTAHICYAYMSSKADSSTERIQESLYGLGLPIWQGALSTILGVIALVLAQSYIFMVFFKMILLVTLFGALHGTFLLPVLLSLMGPGACQSKRNTLTLHPPTDKKPLGDVSCVGQVMGGLRVMPLKGGMEGEQRRVTPPALLTLPSFLNHSPPGEASERTRQEDEKQRRRYLDGWSRSHIRSHSYQNGGYLSDDEVRQWQRPTPDRSRTSPVRPFHGEVRFH